MSHICALTCVLQASNSKFAYIDTIQLSWSENTEMPFLCTFAR